MKNLVIYGAGGMAAETAYLVKEINEVKPEYNIVAFVVDDKWYQENMDLYGIPIKKREWLIENKENIVCSCAIGYPKDRMRIQEELKRDGVKFINLIHPSVKIYQGVSIGEGCIFALNSLISSGAKIGDGVFLSGLVHIGHDSEVADYVTCFPKSQISGGSKIGTGTLIGAMSFINEKKKIGDFAVVAPGSIVLSNVKSNSYVIGNPAKKIDL